MKKHFHHVQRGAQTIYVSIFIAAFLLIIKPNSTITLIVLSAFFVYLFVINFIFFNWKITLTDDAITWHQFGRKKKILYQDITSVKETSKELGLKGDKQTIWITRQTDNYQELYQILKEKVPVMRTSTVSFPWKITFQQGKLRRLIFLEEAIYIQSENSEKTIPITEISHVYLTGGLSGYISFRGSPLFALPVRGKGYHPSDYQNNYDAVIRFNTRQEIHINEQQAESFGYTPEKFVNTLHILYPHTNKDAQKSSPTAKEQIAQAHNHFKTGNYAAAIKLFELGLAHEKFDGQAWNRLGRCYLQLGAYDKAAQAFREAVTINAEDADAYYNGAIAYNQLGNRIMTRVYLQEAFNLQPDMKRCAEENPYLQIFI